MLTTLLLGVLPALLGAGVLVLPPRAGWLGPSRALAVGAALAVVGGELLPAGADALGLLALPLAAAGFVLPALVDRGIARAQARAGARRFALGFAALVLHQLSDGLQMGAARGLGPAVVLAIAAHGAPLIAAAALAFARVMPTAQAAVRTSLLVGATALGILASGLVPDATLDAVSPIVGVALAGLLVHAVTHGLDDDPATRPRARAIEALAFLVGLGGTLALLHGGYDGGAHAGHAHPALPDAVVALAGAGGIVAALGVVTARLRLRPLGDVVLGALLLGPAVGAAQALLAVLLRAPACDDERRNELPWLVVGVLVGAWGLGLAHPAELPDAAGPLLVAAAATATWIGVPAVASLPLLALLAPGPLAPAAAIGAVAATGIGRVVPGPNRDTSAAIVLLAAAVATRLPVLPAAHVGLGGALVLGAAMLAALVREGPRAWIGRLRPHAHHHHHHVVPPIPAR